MKEVNYISIKGRRVMNGAFSNEIVLSKRAVEFSFKDTNTDFQVGSLITYNRKYYYIDAIEYEPIGVYR